MEVAAVASAQSLRRRLLAGAIAFLVVAALALAVIGGILAVRVHAAEQEQQRRQAILQAARQEAIYLTSLDYKTIEKDLQRIMQGATGEVEQMFADRSDVFQKTLSKNEVVTTGEVLSAGLASADHDSAKVLLVVDSTVKNKEVPKGAIRHYRMWMTLVRKDGQWLVSKLDFNKPFGS